MTFVLAVFQSFQIRLADADSWPTGRAKDIEAHRRLVEFLSTRSDVTSAHLEGVRSEVGCIRIRPEELAATGFFNAWPIKFPSAEPMSLRILKSLSKLLSLPAWSLYPETMEIL